MITPFTGLGLTINWKRVVYVFILLVCVASGLTTVRLVTNYQQIERNIIETAKTQAAEQTLKAAQEIDKFLESLYPLVEDLAKDLTAGTLNNEQLIQRLQKKEINIAGFGVEYAPYAFDTSTKLYGPYYVEREGVQTMLQVESLYDYTLPKYLRYNQPMKEGKTIFLEPFFAPGNNTIVAEASTPFFDENKKPIGVVFANSSTEHIQSVMRGLDLGLTGYGFVLSGKGVYVAHPNQERAKQLRTIYDIEQKQHKEY